MGRQGRAWAGQDGMTGKQGRGRALDLEWDTCAIVDNRRRRDATPGKRTAAQLNAEAGWGGEARHDVKQREEE